MYNTSTTNDSKSSSTAADELEKTIGNIAMCKERYVVADELSYEILLSESIQFLRHILD